jgi:phthalate 4,5-dioxygenase
MAQTIPSSLRKMDFRVGPHTALGTALRQFWIPVCASAELPEPDGAPLRVWLLGQRFVAFRDTAGRVGVLDEACPHRKASLVYGNNGGGGLRCLWHQWKFAVDGTVLETPNVVDCAYKDRIRAKAYPVEEAGGLVWTYLGAAAEAPPFPKFEWADLPAENVIVVPIDLDCNFVRPLEGLVDSSHVALLHVDAMSLLPTTSPQSDKSALTADATPKFEFELTDFGFHYAAVRKLSGDAGADAQVRVTAYAAPYTCFIAPGDHAHISVPQDDTHTKFYNVIWNKTARLDTPASRSACMELYGLTDDILDGQGIRSLPPGPGPLGQRNHFVQDRAAMRSGESYSGRLGLTAEDAVMTCSIGSINDYGGEHLVPADMAIARLRRLMAELAQQAEAGGAVGIAKTRTPSTAIAAASGILAAGQNWRSLVPSHIPAAANAL